jgi:glycosyltransferase involved in cell wall biosynthesis
VTASEIAPAQPVVAVVIPAYRVSQHIVEVLEGIGPEVAHVIVVDDACPDGSGDVVEGWAKGRDARIRLVRNKANEGVGGAMIAGYREALKTDAEIIVKVDGDGQMDTSRIKNLIAPIVRGQADYAKGNRFDSLEDLEQMPKIRIFGNAVLSLMSKFSTGYWQITDPTNGFTAIHRRVLERVRLEKLRRGFFFESDMLFRLAIIRAVVVDVPMAAQYGVEKSNLNIRRVIFEFPYRHTVNALKRTFYNYYLREWNVASFELPLGFALLIFGTSFGISSWAQASAAGVVATTGQVMLSAVPVILGAQLLLAFLSYDVSSEPRRPRQFD